MRTVGDLYADLRTAIGRGSANDAVLPTWVQEAINQLENEHDWKWMERALSFDLVPGLESNRVPLGVATLKGIDWVKYGQTNGVGSSQTTTYSDTLIEVDPYAIVSIDYGTAGAYYVDGIDAIVLDAKPAQAAKLFVAGTFFTDWSEYDETDIPPVLARHYAAFKACCMMTAAANLRDDRLVAIWSGMRDRGLAGMVASNDVLRWHGKRKLRAGMYSS